MIKKQIGMSLVELMVVVVIMAVVVSLGYPAWTHVRQAMEANKVKTLLQSVLYEARAHSHITKQDVIVCLADEALRCHRQAQHVVVMFADLNHNVLFDAGDVLLSQERLGLKYGRLQMNVSLHRHHIKYFGQTATPKGHFGHVSYCGTSHSHQVVVNALGGVRVKRGCA